MPFLMVGAQFARIELVTVEKCSQSGLNKSIIRVVG